MSNRSRFKYQDVYHKLCPSPKNKLVKKKIEEMIKSPQTGFTENVLLNL